MANNKFASGTRVTFTSTSIPKMGIMTGTIDDDAFAGMVFIPDEKYHDKLFNLYGVEPEAGLFIDEEGVTIAAA